MSWLTKTRITELQTYFPLLTVLLILSGIIRVYTKYAILGINIFDFMSLNDFVLVFISDAFYLLSLTAGVFFLELAIQNVMNLTKKRRLFKSCTLAIVHLIPTYFLFSLALILPNINLYIAEERIVFSRIIFFTLFVGAAITLFVLKKIAFGKNKVLVFLILVFLVYNTFLLAQYLYPYDYQEQKLGKWLDSEEVKIVTAANDTIAHCNLLIKTENYVIIDKWAKGDPDSAQTGFMALTAIPINNIKEINYKSLYEKNFTRNVRLLRDYYNKTKDSTKFR